jgi:putative lipoprotein
MRLAVAAFALMGLLVSAPHVRAENPWLGPDKAAHFLLSAGLASSGYAFGARHVEDRWACALIGGGIALAAGGAKELADWGRGGSVSPHDLAWDAMGAVVGLVVAFLVDWWIQDALVST